VNCKQKIFFQLSLSFHFSSLFVSSSATTEKTREEAKLVLLSLFNKSRSIQSMEDKENAVDVTKVDRHHQQQRSSSAGGVLKTAATTHGEMLPLSSALKKPDLAPAAAATATVAATPRSIGGARVAHFAATPLGQRTAGDASSVREKRMRKREWKRRASAANSFFPSCLPLSRMSPLS
jgi:hypothetical protein